MSMQPVMDDPEAYETALGERLIGRGKLERAGLERAATLAGVGCAGLAFDVLADVAGH